MSRLEKPNPDNFPKLCAFREEISIWGNSVDPMVAFVDALVASGTSLQSHLPHGLKLDDINPGNLVAALQYATVKTGGEITEYYGIADQNRWVEIIKQALAGGERTDLFIANANRQQQVTVPERYTALRYILNKRYPERDIYGVDFGCSANLGLPLLGTHYLRDDRLEELLSRHGISKTPTIAKGLGIDINPVDTDWLLASAWPMDSNREPLRTLMNQIQLARQLNTDHWLGFAQLDLRNHALAINTIRREFPRGVDFVHTSFAIGRMYDPAEAVEKTLPLVCAVLNEGGVWVNIDNISPETSPDNTRHMVEVWEKKGDGVHFVDLPFILRGQASIDVINENAFSRL